MVGFVQICGNPCTIAATAESLQCGKPADGEGMGLAVLQRHGKKRGSVLRTERSGRKELLSVQ